MRRPGCILRDLGINGPSRLSFLTVSVVDLREEANNEARH